MQHTKRCWISLTPYMLLAENLYEYIHTFVGIWEPWSVNGFNLLIDEGFLFCQSFLLLLLLLQFLLPLLLLFLSLHTCLLIRLLRWLTLLFLRHLALYLLHSYSEYFNYINACMDDHYYNWFSCWDLRGGRVMFCMALHPYKLTDTTSLSRNSISMDTNTSNAHLNYKK